MDTFAVVGDLFCTVFTVLFIVPFKVSYFNGGIMAAQKMCAIVVFLLFFAIFFVRLQKKMDLTFKCGREI